MERVTLRTKILIYLSEYWKYKDKYQLPVEISQEGIARAMGITVSHVPRELDFLIRNKLIEEVKGRVIGKEKKVNVYFLTPEGMLEVDKIKKSYANLNVHFNGRKYKVIDLIENMREMSWLEALNYIQNEMNKESKQPAKKKIYVEATFDGNILDRKDEIKIMENWLKDKSPFLVVIGQEGMGKTSLIGKFLTTVRNMDIIMIQLNMQINIDSLKNKIESIYNGSFDHIIKNKNALIIFDNYYLVDDSIVEFMQNLVRDKNSGKMIISMREDTPSYNRFYSQDDVSTGKVTELRIKGLPMKVIKDLFPGLSQERVEVIYQLTGGKPMLLKGLVEGNEEIIIKNSNITPEQAKFMIDLVRIKEQEEGF